MKEIWKDIKGYEGLYQISDMGRIKSSHGNGRILKPSPRDGYMTTVLCNNKKRKTVKVHQLVAIAFLDHEPNGITMVVDHINKDTLDNRLSNLQVITHRENTTKDRSNKNGYTGVSMHRPTGTWSATIRVNGKRESLGYFDTELKAHNAYKKRLDEIRK